MVATAHAVTYRSECEIEWDAVWVGPRERLGMMSFKDRLFFTFVIGFPVSGGLVVAILYALAYGWFD